MMMTTGMTVKACNHALKLLNVAGISTLCCLAANALWLPWHACGGMTATHTAPQVDVMTSAFKSSQKKYVWPPAKRILNPEKRILCRIVYLKHCVHSVITTRVGAAFLQVPLASSDSAEAGASQLLGFRGAEPHSAQRSACRTSMGTSMPAQRHLPANR
jgi:hypothetical protein